MQEKSRICIHFTAWEQLNLISLSTAVLKFSQNQIQLDQNQNQSPDEVRPAVFAHLLTGRTHSCEPKQQTTHT